MPSVANKHSSVDDRQTAPVARLAAPNHLRWRRSGCTSNHVLISRVKILPPPEKADMVIICAIGTDYLLFRKEVFVRSASSGPITPSAGYNSAEHRFVRSAGLDWCMRLKTVHVLHQAAREQLQGDERHGSHTQSLRGLLLTRLRANRGMEIDISTALSYCPSPRVAAGARSLFVLVSPSEFAVHITIIGQFS